MFKLEKVLQNDDSAYIYFTFIVKSIVVFLSYYIFSILEKNSIYELSNTERITNINVKINLMKLNLNLTINFSL